LTRHLQTLGRDHGPDDVRAAVDAAGAVGFENLSLDLIFGVPAETLADWEADLAQAVTLAPAHVSTYALTYESGTPFHAWRARGRLRALDERAVAGALSRRGGDDGDGSGERRAADRGDRASGVLLHRPPSDRRDRRRELPPPVRHGARGGISARERPDRRRSPRPGGG